MPAHDAMTRPTLSRLRLVELATGGRPSLAERAAIGGDPALRDRLDGWAEVHDRVRRVAWAPPPPAERRRLLAATADPWWRALDDAAALADLEPEELRALLAEARQGAWLPWVPAGVELYHFAGGPKLADADVGLLRAGPGHGFPWHRHRRRERALVLEGEVHEGERRLRVGELCDQPPGSAHAWSAGPAGVVLLVVRDAETPG